MARYLFRRQWGAKTETEMLEGALRSKRMGRDFDDVTWRRASSAGCSRS